VLPGGGGGRKKGRVHSFCSPPLSTLGRASARDSLLQGGKKRGGKKGGGGGGSVAHGRTIEPPLLSVQLSMSLARMTQQRKKKERKKGRENVTRPRRTATLPVFCLARRLPPSRKRGKREGKRGRGRRRQGKTDISSNAAARGFTTSLCSSLFSGECARD